MVSIGQPFSPHSSHPQSKGPDEAFDLPRKGLSSLDSGSNLAFVEPGRETNINLLRGVANLLEAGISGVAALAGYVVGIGSQLLRELLSNPTADTRELVRIIRDLEAQGLGIDSAVALRELPNGNIGVYAIRDPDDPFPELLATINGQTGEITTQQPPSGASDPLEWNPGNPPDLRWQGLGVEDNGWRPGETQLDFNRPYFPPVNREGLDLGDFRERFDAMGRELEERWNQRSEDTPSFFDPKTRLPSFTPPNDDEDDKDDNTGAPELPPSRPLHGGSTQKDDAVERLQEALEAARRIIFEPGGFFGDGVDPRDEMYQRFGYIGLFAYDVAAAEQGVQDGSGGTSAAAGASARVANYLSVLPAEIAAAIVNHLAGRLGAVPEMYREALARALDKGDPEDPEIRRAKTLLENAGETEEGQGPEAFTGTDGTTHVDLGQNEALREQILDQLRDIANIDQFSDDLDRETIQRAVIAGQIIAAILRDPSRVIAALGPDGNVLGVGSFSFRETENGEPAIFVNDILALESGHNVGLKLLQAIYDLGPGIMKLLSLTPELDDYYTARGGQNLGCPPGPGDSCSRFRWDERPDMVGEGEEGTPSTQPSTGASTDTLPPLTPDEERLVEREVRAGTFTREVFDAFRQANPGMSVVELVIELSMLMQGYDSKLTIPDAFSQTSEAGPPASTYVYGTDPVLDARTREELNRLIALGESGVPLDPRTEAAAMIADQIRKNLDTADNVLVALGPEGEPLGVMTYTYFANPDDPTGPRILFIEDIVSFVPGQGIGLKLLQEAFDLSEGIIGLTAMPGALEYYLSLGARLRDEGGTGPLPYLLWTDRPERQEP